MKMLTLTVPLILSAIWICAGPVQYACGKISPKITTKIVEIRIATNAGTILCKKTGKASMAKAFDTNKVPSNKWCFARIGIIFAALNRIKICLK